ncbi:MAG: TIM barrel protein [Bryobacteraceae bacterium]|nr:TIM barrel protein [Bryobacteraceae bacterium]MDW8378381.1 TIM barrel protein [Bryobacterales bacterium]
MTRRSFASSLSAPAVLSAASQLAPKARKGRLRQSACRWCYRDIPLEDLAREGAKLGLVGIDLIGPDEWPVVQKYGLTPTMAPGCSTITNGLNRPENHDRFEKDLRANLKKAKAAKVPNLIVFSGNRNGMADAEGLEHCVNFLNRVKAEAEDLGITICMELLNSKVNHKDYMCDHTAWGVEMCRRVNSPRVKLLYDIYHMQIMEGDVIRTIRDNIQWIAHFHTGGVPGRNEIDHTQELYYPAIVQAILETGFSGYLAHEFIPKRTPLRSLEEAITLCDL